MKFSNTLLLATVTVALAMVAVPADAQSLSRSGGRGSHLRGVTLAPASTTSAILGGLPLGKSWDVQMFATDDAPSAVGTPPTNVGTPTTASPIAHPHRHTRRGHRRPRRHHGRRNSSAARRRRHRHSRTGQGHAHGHGPSQGHAHGHRHSRGHRRGHPHRRRHQHAHGKPTTSTPAQVPTSATPPTTRSATAASLEDISPQSNYYRSMEPVRRVHSNQYVSDLARFEQIKARRNRMSAIKNSAKHSLSDSGYNYESFDDEYDEGFSISEDAAFGDDDDAWEETWEE